MNRHRRTWLAFAMMLMPLYGHAVSYSATPIEARIVDAQTHEPLERVNVVAHWVLNFGVEGTIGADLVLMETMTDRDGRFRFPGWGPKPTPPELPSDAYLYGMDPEIILFKQEYKPTALSNGTHGPQMGPGPPVRSWGGDGKTFKLKRFQGNPKIYGSLISGVLTGVGWGRCEWTKIPRMIAALNEASDHLRQQGVFKPTVITPSLAFPSLIELEADSAQSGCGSVADYLRGDKK